MKKNKIFAEIVGNEIKKWVKGHYKYRSMKILSRELEISPSDLSRYCSGEREMPGRIVDRLLKLGFKESIFTEFYSKEFHKAAPENLSKDDLIKLILEYQRLLDEYKTLYFAAITRTTKYIDREDRQTEALQSIIKKMVKVEVSK